MIDKDTHKELGRIEILFDGVPVLKTKNRIVATSRSVKASSLVGGPSADFISTMKLGYVGSATPSIVLENETNLANAILELAIPYDQDPRPFYQDDQALAAPDSIVTWTGIAPVDQSITFDEAGLFSSNGYMFSRATFPVVQKPIGVTMSLRWSIEL